MTPLLIVQKTQEPFPKAILSVRHGVRDAKPSECGQSQKVFLLRLEAFLLPTQKELLFKSKKYIDTKEENKSK